MRTIFKGHTQIGAIRYSDSFFDGIGAEHLHSASRGNSIFSGYRWWIFAILARQRGRRKEVPAARRVLQPQGMTTIFDISSEIPSLPLLA